jgi:hypothetical protein
MAPDGAKEYVHSVAITNHRTTSLELFLEPWLEKFEIPAGESFDIIGRGPQDGTIEIEIRDQYVAAWPWRKGTLVVLHNGVELGDHGMRLFSSFALATQCALICFNE